jgi:hypothetical protein
MALKEASKLALESALTEPSAYTEVKRILEGTGYQALADEAVTIDSTTTIAVCTADAGSSRVITMPAAVAGTTLRVIWQVEQATSDRVFTRAGSDDFVGAIFTSKAGNAAGDGDVVAVTDGTVAITVVDDVNPGSYLDFHCAVAGQWIVTGQLVIDAVASVPTIA